MGSLFTFVGVTNEGNCPQCSNSRINPKKLTLYVQFRSQTMTLKVPSQLLIHKLKDILHRKYNILPTTQQLIFDDVELLDGDTLTEYKIQDEDTINLIAETQTRGIESDKMHYNCRTGKIIIGKEHSIFGKSERKSIEISGYHVSCQSDPIRGQNMVGVVLYLYNNKTDWRLNGLHCKSGYIILKSIENIENIHIAYNCRKQGTVHGKCYKSVFGEEIAHHVVGGGFAFKNNEWIFRSSAFNDIYSDGYHDREREMHKLERACVMAAIENWKRGVQNTKCSDIRSKYQGYCRKCHYFF